MTKFEKEKLTAMRIAGDNYRKISEELGICIDTVKSYCRRNNLDYETLANCQFCPVCGKPLVQSKGHRQKKYCCEQCRRTWWKEHPELKQRLEKSIYKITCQYCGKEVESYGFKERKYCSMSCYLNSKVKEAVNA